VADKSKLSLTKQTKRNTGLLLTILPEVVDFPPHWPAMAAIGSDIGWERKGTFKKKRVALEMKYMEETNKLT